MPRACLPGETSADETSAETHRVKTHCWRTPVSARIHGRGGLPPSGRSQTLAAGAAVALGGSCLVVDAGDRDSRSSACCLPKSWWGFLCAVVLAAVLAGVLFRPVFLALLNVRAERTQTVFVPRADDDDHLLIVFECAGSMVSIRDDPVTGVYYCRPMNGSIERRGWIGWRGQLGLNSCRTPSAIYFANSTGSSIDRHRGPTRRCELQTTGRSLDSR